MIAIIQHVAHESPGWILDWLSAHNMAYMLVDISREDPLPSSNEIDGLIVLGGSMNVYEESRYPWLSEEKDLIRRCIKHQKKVFGICLGAQLISVSLGAKVKRNAALEVGWYPVHFPEGKLPKHLGNVFPGDLMTFHWHGDMFEIPQGARLFATSEACNNQGYTYGKHVMAIQFHPEMTEEGINKLIMHDTDDLFSESVFVQTVEQIRQGFTHITENKEFLFRVLTSFFTGK